MVLKQDLHRVHALAALVRRRLVAFDRAGIAASVVADEAGGGGGGGSHQIVHRKVAGQGPGSGERRIAHARNGGGTQTRRPDRAGEFRRSRESLEAVRARRQPAQQVFRADLRLEQARRRAVEGREKHGPAGLEQSRRRADEGAEVRDMLDELQRENGIEAFAGQRFDRGAAVVDVEAGRFCMGARDRDGLRFRIDSGNLCAQARQRFRDEAAAAAGIQHAEAGQRTRRQRIPAEALGDPVAHPADPDRIHGMQRLELTLRVPPFVRYGGETPGFLRVQGRAGFCHRNLFHPEARNMLRPPAGGKRLQAV